MKMDGLSVISIQAKVSTINSTFSQRPNIVAATVLHGSVHNQGAAAV